jgi:hypothetical protein
LLRLGRCRQSDLVLPTKLPVQLGPLPFALRDPIAIYGPAEPQIRKFSGAEFYKGID